MTTSIRLLFLNNFSVYWEKIFLRLEQAGLYPEGSQPQNKAEFLEQLLNHDPDAILIAHKISDHSPRFNFEAVQEWLAERKSKIPIWMLVNPQDEEAALEAMYQGLSDYFFTDRLARLAPAAARLVGRYQQTLEPVNLNQILEGTLKEYRPFFQARNLPLTFLPGADLPLFPGEPTSLTQAVLSIFRTIVEAVPPETKTDIRTYLDAVKAEVCLETKLSGEGLQTEQQIEATAVSESTLTEPGEIIEAQNGRIDIEEGEEFGIRICLSFPAILQKKLLGSPKLLVVENSLLMRSILQEALEQEGFTVRTAENGVEGLESMAVFQPDLIISDIIMPIMDGFDFFEAVRQKPEWQDIPFIFVTGQSDQREHLNTQALRGATYLIKPIIIEELLVAVHSRLSG